MSTSKLWKSYDVNFNTLSFLFFGFGLSLTLVVSSASLFNSGDPKDYGEARRRLKNAPSRVTIPDGVAHSEAYTINSRGMVLYTQRFSPVGCKPKGLIFLCHGYAETTLWFFRDIALDYTAKGYACIGIDYEGHGKSDGLHCFIPNFDQMVSDVVTFFDQVRAEPEYLNLPCFLHGESMGGAVAIEISLRQPQAYQGMILQAPMCKISDKIKPPPIVVSFLTWLAKKIPEKAWTPSGDVINNAFKLASKRNESRSNPWSYQRKPRLATAISLIQFSEYLERRLGEVTMPFLLCHGAADTVTEPEVSKALFQNAQSSDKTFKLYDEMWHSLLNEPEENKLKVWNDIISWVSLRAR